MVSSKPLSLAALSLAAAFLSTTVAAQLGAMPMRRYRNTSLGSAEPAFGREPEADRKPRHSVRRRTQRGQRHNGGMRQLDADGSLSMGLTTFNFEFPDLGGSMSMSMPATETADSEKDTVALETDSTSSTSLGSTMILASILAGFSALLVAAAALFVKMRRVHRREAEEDDGSINSAEVAAELADLQGERDMRMVSMVSVASVDEFDDVELEAQGRSVRIY